jgi:hypothetical protein
MSLVPGRACQRAGDNNRDDPGIRAGGRNQPEDDEKHNYNFLMFAWFIDSGRAFQYTQHQAGMEPITRPCTMWIFFEVYLLFLTWGSARANGMKPGKRG